jgi:hypothetical protein
MTRHTLHNGAIIPVRGSNVLEFCRPDLPPLDGDALIIELRQEIEALEWTLTGMLWVGLVMLAAGVLGWSLWAWAGVCR